MVQVDKIQDALLHLIGWKQTTNNIEGASVCESLTESESGLYFQQAHPLITIDNLFCVAPDFSANEETASYSEYEAYKQTAQASAMALRSVAVVEQPKYNKGQVVIFGGKLYKALQDITDISTSKTANPSTLQDEWAETSLFSEWLESKVKGSIAKVVNRFINDKLVSNTTKAICENKALFDGTGRLTDTITNRNNLVGLEIVPIRAKGITTKINKIGLQFTKPGQYILYLMHSSSEEPVAIISVDKQHSGFEWIKVDNLLLPYSSEFTDAGGSWYLCYKQSELPEGSQAINKDKDWSKGPCKSCSRSEFMSWQAWSKYLEIHPFSIKEAEGEMSMWDVENNNYEYNKNYGINLDISIHCDLTEFIIEQRSLFTDLIMKQFAIDMLREFAYNPNVRTNRHSINVSRMDILYELDGDSSSMKKSGLSYQLEQAFKAVEFSTQGLDRVCLPCKNNGVKYRTV